MDTRKPSILVIDDELKMRQVLGRVLTNDGYEVKLAADGNDALLQVDAGPAPDLILLDLLMPVMSGFEVLSALRVNPVWAKIPVIVMSGTAGYSAGHLGVAATLVKPFETSEVQQAIRQALGRR